MAHAAPPSDWVVPALTIAVATLPRSGSNFLKHLMAGTGRLGRPDEFFHRNLWSERPWSVPDRCHLVIEEGQSANGVAATKLFPDHLEAIQASIAFSEWFGRPKWIWLRRGDMLGQAISMAIALQTKQWTSAQKATGTPIYSPERVLRQIHLMAKRDAYWASYFARTEAAPLPILYEEVIKSPERTLTRISEFTGVELPDADATVPPGIERQHSAINEQWRRQFIESHGDPDVFEWPMPGIANHLWRAGRSYRRSLIRFARRR